MNENMTVDDAKGDLETSCSLARQPTGILSKCGKNCLGSIIEIPIHKFEERKLIADQSCWI